MMTMTGDEKVEQEEKEKVMEGGMGGFSGKVIMVSEEEAAEEIMLVWGLQQPTFSKHNAFVLQSSLLLPLDACGRSLSILQSPCSLATPGVTGSVMWDSGVVLGKFLEHASETREIDLRDKKVVELGSGCGLVGCIAALLGAQAVLTDMPDRLKLMKKNVDENLYGNVRGSATVIELTWGDDPDPKLINPSPDYGTNLRSYILVLGSDVIYSEDAVTDLIETLVQLSGPQTTIILAGELRNDAILEYFLEAAMKVFVIGRIGKSQWHPDYCSSRVVMYVLMKK